MKICVYKLLRRSEWEEAARTGFFAGSHDDHRDGFIHLSAASQVRGTFEKYFAAEREPVLAAFAADSFGVALKWEISRNGERFPHLYGALDVSRALSVSRIARDACGTPEFPAEIPIPRRGLREMSKYQGSCHCNAVQFEIDADMASGVQCDCSLCKRKNAVMLRVPKDKFRLLKGENALSLYEWNTRAAKHYFCKHCGIYTHHQPRTRADMIGVNLGCIDDIDASKLPVERLPGSGLSGGR